MTEAFETDAFDEIRRLQDQIELLRALIQERDVEFKRLRRLVRAFSLLSNPKDSKDD